MAVVSSLSHRQLNQRSSASTRMTSIISHRFRPPIQLRLATHVEYEDDTVGPRFWWKATTGIDVVSARRRPTSRLHRWASAARRYPRPLRCRCRLRYVVVVVSWCTVVVCIVRRRNQSSGSKGCSSCNRAVHRLIRLFIV